MGPPIRQLIGPIIGSGTGGSLASSLAKGGRSISASSRGVACQFGEAGPIRLGRRVREAIANGEPVVALESTVITHGLPEPANLRLALSLERQVASFEPHQSRAAIKNGAATNAETAAVLSSGPLLEEPAPQPAEGNFGSAAGRFVQPATVGIIKGELIVGLSGFEIEYLAQRERSHPIKASRRDIAVAMGRKLSAGTTVAGTLALASSLGSGSGPRHRCPIRVFATGGLGGVHRGGQLSMDVSADLFELARAPLCVVASGFKSFLDTRRSLELLETLGCTVMSLPAGPAGQGGPLFPGFLTLTNPDGAESPLLLADQPEGLTEAARLLYSNFAGPLRDKCGSLLGVPIPAEHCMDEQMRRRSSASGEDFGGLLARLSALVDQRLDVAGKDKTPMILRLLSEQTKGKSLAANVALLENNARVGARLAYEYVLLENRTGKIGQGLLVRPP